MELDAFERMQGSRFYRFFECVSRLILVNLCMVLLSLCGLVVFGFFPAMFAAAAYFNDVFECKEEKMLSSMFRYFRKYFGIGNVLMLITVPTIALGFYIIYGHELSTFAYLILFCWIIITMVLYWYLPAVNVLFPEFEPKKKFLFSLVAAGDRWVMTILLLAVNLGWLYIVLLMPQLMMFVMFSAPVWFGVLRIKKTLKPDSFFDPEREEEFEEDFFDPDREDEFEKEIEKISFSGQGNTESQK